MNYYKRHIGDYAKKAGHLSILEHGVYTLLMDAYYDREQAPTRQEAIRISRARTPDELAALDAVLADFFTETDGRYVQTRIEEEFTKAEAQAVANQANGKHGGRPRKPKGETKKAKENQTKTHSVSDENQNDNEKNPNPPIHQSINPTTEDQKTSATGVARFEEFWAEYPNKKGKAQAEKFWKRDKLDCMANTIIADVERRKAGDWDWIKDGGQYIPHGSTYVTQKRWLDEIKPRPNAPPETKPSKLAQGLEALERMKHGLVQNRNTNGIAEAGFARLGVDSADGDDSGYGSGVV